MIDKNPNLFDADDNQVIWRYMTISKFVSLLSTKQLFFCSLENLEDRREGCITEATRKHLLDRHNEPNAEKQFGPIESSNQYMDYIFQRRKHIFVNCWHMNEHESDAMWKLYLNSGEGIAIKTTVGRLTRAMKPPLRLGLSGGKIQYVDFNLYNIENRNLLSIATHKRLSFAHESEFRLLFYKEENCTGISVPCNLESLIDKVYLPPYSQSWLGEIVSSLLEKYELDRGVIQSEI